MFGFRKKPQPPVYIIMDRDSHVLAKGALQGEPTDQNVQLKITEGTADAVVKAEIVQAASNAKDGGVLMGRVIFRRGNLVVLEPMRALGSAVRRNFRMPADFESLLYLPGGGRYLFKAIDLSCGGIAFFCAGELTVDEIYEVVIPITADGPLIVRFQLLRRMEDAPPLHRYAGKFPDLLDDEESMIREAVFNIEMETVRISRQRSRQSTRKRG